MERKGRFTRGPVEPCYDNNDNGAQWFDVGPCTVPCGGTPYATACDTARYDASLIASAFNAATTCEDMGYDGEACVKALPELVELAEFAAPRYGVPDWEREAALEKIAELVTKCRVRKQGGWEMETKDASVYVWLVVDADGLVLRHFDYRDPGDAYRFSAERPGSRVCRADEGIDHLRAVNAELLEALEVAECSIDAYSGGESSDLDSIRSAIAKAKGE